jgi:hypothetical protein
LGARTSGLATARSSWRDADLDRGSALSLFAGVCMVAAETPRESAMQSSMSYRKGDVVHHKDMTLYAIAHHEGAGACRQG